MQVSLDIYNWKIVGGIRSVPKDHEYEMAFGDWNGRVIDNVTWPRKLKVVTPVCSLSRKGDDIGQTQVCTSISCFYRNGVYWHVGTTVRCCTINMDQGQERSGWTMCNVLVTRQISANVDTAAGVCTTTLILMTSQYLATSTLRQNMPVSILSH